MSGTVASCQLLVVMQDFSVLAVFVFEPVGCRYVPTFTGLWRRRCGLAAASLEASASASWIALLLGIPTESDLTEH